MVREDEVARFLHSIRWDLQSLETVRKKALFSYLLRWLFVIAVFYFIFSNTEIQKILTTNHCHSAAVCNQQKLLFAIVVSAIILAAVQLFIWMDAPRKEYFSVYKGRIFSKMKSLYPELKYSVENSREINEHPMFEFISPAAMKKYKGTFGSEGVARKEPLENFINMIAKGREDEDKKRSADPFSEPDGLIFLSGANACPVYTRYFKNNFLMNKGGKKVRFFKLCKPSLSVRALFNRDYRFDNHGGVVFLVESQGNVFAGETIFFKRKKLKFNKTFLVRLGLEPLVGVNDELERNFEFYTDNEGEARRIIKTGIIEGILDNTNRYRSSDVSGVFRKNYTLIIIGTKIKIFEPYALFTKATNMEVAGRIVNDVRCAFKITDSIILLQETFLKNST